MGAVNLSVSNTSLPLLQWIRERFDGYVYEPGRRCNGVGIWMMRGERVAALLEQVLPYLIVKRAQAEVALVYHHRRRPYAALTGEERARDEELDQHLRALKRAHRHRPTIAAQWVSGLAEGEAEGAF